MLPYSSLVMNFTFTVDWLVTNNDVIDSNSFQQIIQCVVQISRQLYEQLFLSRFDNCADGNCGGMQPVMVDMRQRRFSAKERNIPLTKPTLAYIPQVRNIRLVVNHQLGALFSTQAL